MNMNNDEPVTGVLLSSAPEWMHDDMHDAISIEFAEYLLENPDDEGGDNYICDDETFLIGFRKTDNGMYEPDTAAPYSAVVSSPYMQVVRSRHVSMCAMCSPCYPDAGDLDTPGDILAYNLPPPDWGNADHLPIMDYISEKDIADATAAPDWCEYFDHIEIEIERLRTDLSAYRDTDHYEKLIRRIRDLEKARDAGAVWVDCDDTSGPGAWATLPTYTDAAAVRAYRVWTA